MKNDRPSPVLDRKRSELARCRREIIDTLEPTDSVERFTLGDLNGASGTALGSFSDATPLDTPRAFHAATAASSSVIISGGWNTGGPLPNVEIYTPKP